MTDAQAKQLIRAMEICERDGLRAVKGTGKNGQTVWAVPSRTYANHYYVIYLDNGRIRCQCHAAQLGKICAHAACVRSAILAERETAQREEARRREASFVVHSKKISPFR